MPLLVLSSKLSSYQMACVIADHAGSTMATANQAKADVL